MYNLLHESTHMTAKGRIMLEASRQCRRESLAAPLAQLQPWTKETAQTRSIKESAVEAVSLVGSTTFAIQPRVTTLQGAR